MTLNDCLDLADWRRTVAELYADVRRLARSDPRAAWLHWRAGRRRLFVSHPSTPLDETQRARFQELPLYPYDPALRLSGQLVAPDDAEEIAVALPEGHLVLQPVARVRFAVHGQRAELLLFWISGYGGGLFLPFGDATNGDLTYGGGRYLYDAIKGADLGTTPDSITLDFNFAYNPSCAYNSRWICPLPPPQNRLALPIGAGEQDFARAG